MTYGLYLFGRGVAEELVVKEARDTGLAIAHFAETHKLRRGGGPLEEIQVLLGRDGKAPIRRAKLLRDRLCVLRLSHREQPVVFIREFHQILAVHAQIVPVEQDEDQQALVLAHGHLLHRLGLLVVLHSGPKWFILSGRCWVVRN